MQIHTYYTFYFSYQSTLIIRCITSRKRKVVLSKKAWEKGDRNEDPNIKKINRLVAPLYIDNEGYLVLITEKVFSNPQSIGLYTVEEIDIKKESDGLTKVADADKIDLMAFPLSNSVRNILQQLELVNQNTTILHQQAYHGSPYNFERFTTDAIGTGEGAQSFGWGLYFTNQEDIARWYADKLTFSDERRRLLNKKEYLSCITSRKRKVVL